MWLQNFPFSMQLLFGKLLHPSFFYAETVGNEGPERRVILLEQFTINMKWVLFQNPNKDEIRQAGTECEIDTGFREAIRNPEKGKDVEAENVDVLGPVFLVRIQYDFKATGKSEDIEGIRGYSMDRVCYGK